MTSAIAVDSVAKHTISLMTDCNALNFKRGIVIPVKVLTIIP